MVINLVHRSLSFVLLAFAGLLAIAAPAGALPPGFSESVLADGLTQPTAVAFAPAADGRMFIAEKAGIVKVRAADGSVSQLLDWTARVNSPSDPVNGDRGLLGIATDRDFASNGYLYLLYVSDADTTDDTGPQRSRLSRVTVGPGNSVSAETVLVGGTGFGPCPSFTTENCIPASAPTHVIGTVASDPRDGSVWFGTGDATPQPGEAGNRAQRMFAENQDSLAGKIVRVDRNGSGLATNPYCVGQPAKNCNKVYAKGFRNPFRFTVPSVPGAEPIVADVGNGQREEINVIRKGGYYGWPCWEGADVQPYDYGSSYAPCSPYIYPGGLRPEPSKVDYPEVAWGHPVTPGERRFFAAIAGPVADGPAWPSSYRGGLLFGDLAEGWVRWIAPSSRPDLAFAFNPTLVADWRVTPTNAVLFDQRQPFTMAQLTTAPDGTLVIVERIGGRVVQVKADPSLVTDPNGSPGTTAPASTTPPAATTPPSPVRPLSKPKLALSSPWPGRTRTPAIEVAGAVTNVSAEPVVQVALAQSAGTRCRWWATTNLRFSAPASCGRPLFTRATVKRRFGAWRYTLRFGAPIARRPGRIVARVMDRGTRVAQVTVRVSRAR